MLGGGLAERRCSDDCVRPRFGTIRSVTGVVERLEGLLNRPGRHRNDASTVDEFRWPETDPALPSGLELQWLGTAGFRLAYEGTTVLIDPYLTRPSLRSSVRRRPLRASPAAVERYVQDADAVLVGHTHFDHAMDVPAIAVAHGCPVYGSPSLGHLMGLHGLAAQAVGVEPGRIYEIGPFEVTFVPSRHSRLLLGLKVPADGELTCDCLDDLGMGAYRCGEVYGIHIAVGGATFYHQGSADLDEDEIRHRGVDVFLAGIAGRMYTPRYVDRILRLLDPTVVVPQHHDDFFRPLSDPMGFSFNVNYGGFVEDVLRVNPDITVRSLDQLQTVTGV